MFRITVFFCVVLLGVCGYPARDGYLHMSTYPQAVMFGGYYTNPIFGRSYNYIPQGAMSTFVSRDAMATNTFGAGPEGIPPGQLPLEEDANKQDYTERNEIYEPIPVKGPQSPIEEDVSSVVDEAAPTEAAPTTKAPTRVIRKKKARRPSVVVVEEAEDEDDDIPTRRDPSHNVYFPITISGGGARTRTGAKQDDEYYYPSSATAIANAYSTGKGGIATSHATSFGDPYMAAMLYRNGYFKSKKGLDLDSDS